VAPGQIAGFLEITPSIFFFKFYGYLNAVCWSLCTVKWW